MSKKTVLVLSKPSPGMQDPLEHHFECVDARSQDPEKIIRDHAGEIQAIYTSLIPVSRSLIEVLPNLEIISIGAVGYDHVDLQAAFERDIKVTNTPDVLNDDTADTALLLLLNTMRRAVEGDAFVRAGMWKSGKMPLGHTLAGKKVGVLGLGRIGKAIAQRVQAFKMEVSYCGRNKQKDQPYQYYSDLKEMAQDVDVLILACPGGAETQDIINYEILEALGPQGYLINIARGSVVNEDDLLRALSNRTIMAAGLDVYKNEPNIREELFTMDNVVITPHIGSATVETRTKMGQIALGNLLAHFEGKPLLTPIPQ